MNNYLIIDIEYMSLSDIEKTLERMETVSKYIGAGSDATPFALVNAELIQTLCIITRELSHRMRRLDAAKDINP